MEKGLSSNIYQIAKPHLSVERGDNMANTPVIGNGRENLADLLRQPGDVESTFRVWERAVTPMVPAKMMTRFRDEIAQTETYISGKFARFAVPNEFDGTTMILKPEWVYYCGGFDTRGRIAFNRDKDFHWYTRSLRFMNDLLRDTLGKRNLAMQNNLLGDINDVHATSDRIRAAEKRELYKRLKIGTVAEDELMRLSTVQPGAFIVLRTRFRNYGTDVRPIDALKGLGPDEFALPISLAASSLWIRIKTNKVLWSLETPRSDFQFGVACLGDEHCGHAKNLKSMGPENGSWATELSWHSQNLSLRDLHEWPLRIDQRNPQPLTLGLGYIPPAK